jgi:hypothetical protein
MLSRIVAAALGFMALAILGPAGVRSALAGDIGGPPPIFVDGRLVHEPAILDHGHLLVPVRGVFEALAARVEYTAPRIVVVRKNEMVIAGLVVDRNEAVVNNRKRRIAVAPIRRGDHVYVPLRFVAEIAGAGVMYSSHPRLVDIRAAIDKPAIAPKRPAEIVPPPDSAAPLWAFGLVGMLVTALGAEVFRRLTATVRAKRTGVPR